MLGQPTVATVKLRDPLDFRRRRIAFVGILRPTKMRLAKAARRVEKSNHLGTRDEALAYIAVMTNLPKGACTQLSHDDAKALMIAITDTIGGTA
ncbi:hypothetical protein [uncultured Roseibium sp.]|uniref:hypothetical protein n=1 Tax=uncultured Roseibium sp. TaxID=1936171 RepID=UPI00321684FA